MRKHGHSNGKQHTDESGTKDQRAQWVKGRALGEGRGEFEGVEERTAGRAGAKGM